MQNIKNLGAWEFNEDTEHCGLRSPAGIWRKLGINSILTPRNSGIFFIKFSLMATVLGVQSRKVVISMETCMQFNMDGYNACSNNMDAKE